MLHKFGGTRLGVWVIKRIVTPFDRVLYRSTGGRFTSTGRPLGPMLLLTTLGRKSGKRRTTPVFYLRDGERIVLCNVNPGFERTNPWVANLRANQGAEIQIGAKTFRCVAREADDVELKQYWPMLVAVWPAYQVHFERSGQRTVFVLERVD